jgi:hypothetical protein
MPIQEPGARVPDSELDYDDELTYKWHGALYSGIGFAEAVDGSRSEVSYRYGVQDGPARDWYPSGVLKAESWFRDNVQHGMAREYDDSGSLISEISFEYGIIVSKRERSPEGLMIRTFEIDRKGQSYARLERYRHEKGWPS